jgi:integrase
MAENLSRREALEDKNIERWYDNLQRRSLQTAETYLRRLMMFCRDNNISPEELLEIDENDLRDMLLDYVTRLSRTHSGNYINTIIHAVKNFLEFNHKKVSIRVYLRRESNASKKEKTPTKDELRKLLFFAKDMRARALTSLVAFSGLRLFSIGYHDGSDGLRLGDLPDLNIDNLEFEKVPSAIIVRQELSKAKHQYITFAGRQTCEYILGYLRWRKSRGEELSENSPLIATRSRKFLYTNQISSILRESILIAGYEWRPYLLRHYFDTQLLLAEGSGYIPNDYRVFWMGIRAT